MVPAQEHHQGEALGAVVVEVVGNGPVGTVPTGQGLAGRGVPIVAQGIPIRIPNRSRKAEQLGHGPPPHTLGKLGTRVLVVVLVLSTEVRLGIAGVTRLYNPEHRVSSRCASRGLPSLVS